MIIALLLVVEAVLQVREQISYDSCLENVSSIHPKPSPVSQSILQAQLVSRSGELLLQWNVKQNHITYITNHIGLTILGPFN